MFYSRYKVYAICPFIIPVSIQQEIENLHLVCAIINWLINEHLYSVWLLPERDKPIDNILIANLKKWILYNANEICYSYRTFKTSNLWLSYITLTVIGLLRIYLYLTQTQSNWNRIKMHLFQIPIASLEHEWMNEWLNRGLMVKNWIILTMTAIIYSTVNKVMMYL